MTEDRQLDWITGYFINALEAAEVNFCTLLSHGDFNIAVHIDESEPVRLNKNSAGLVQDDGWSHNFHISLELIKRVDLCCELLSFALDLEIHFGQI